MTERTLIIIKPDGIQRHLAGQITGRLEQKGFKLVAAKFLHISEEKANQLYSVHKGKPFYDSLVKFMSSGPVIAAILEKDNAVEDYRDLIGATDPGKAVEGTIRQLYGTSLQQNAVHGSDSDENAVTESDFFFSELERV